MRDHLILLPGWGLGAAPLEPLVEALHALDEHLRVEIKPLPEMASEHVDDWLDALDGCLPDNVWLGGWSLGGMLAAELAARRGDRCCGLLTLASNPCFVSNPEWSSAMLDDTFEAFVKSCRDDPQATLKRFSLLCAQGALDPRSLARQLLNGAPDTDASALLNGLQVLGELDTRAALQTFCGPQLHLFASLDGLVPVGAANALLTVVPDVEIGLVELASHAFLLEAPHTVAVTIQAFLHESGDD